MEKNIHYLTQRWWRTLAVSSFAQAQADLDRFCQTTGDGRRRGEVTVAQLAEAEQLLELPAVAFPAVTVETRLVAANALVSLDGNRYSVPPELVGAEVTVRPRVVNDGVGGQTQALTPPGVPAGKYLLGGA